MTTPIVLHHNSVTHCISLEAKKPNSVYRVHTNTLIYMHMYHFILQAGRQARHVSNGKQIFCCIIVSLDSYRIRYMYSVC